ncbi:DegT/DnrJ/EryC1/StrS family aminotransferase [Fluviispira sanaruensis]|uniref:DegT/DnrJ/EryC1/StrS family aminotransferase n=1 Tax=Fluviispira sanaruensis TaxID=2493639 RepID=A0A4P2VMP4_FLUSA|nr:DegT/DnrJ/EryC1/StrS family aminotransferase [Fluviispira sanaruensis]BBH54058.1 DegT/DnrJ/EryC1/StrS family aminotransferase [Fluviispira sanaruensis]
MLRLSMACVDNYEIESLKKVFFESTHFGLGSYVEKFEQEIKNFLNSEYEVICVNTGTAALHIALESLAFPKGSEVIVPSITFVASYSAICAAGLIPVSCDVTFPDCHLDCEDLQKRITKKTVAIMPVAYSGTDFNRNLTYEIASKYNLRVIEDDAHAFGSLNQDGVQFGASGDIICFSFDGIKNITCGEGGAVLTKDKVLAHKLRVMRSLGIEKDVELRYKGQRAWEYDVTSLGYRYHMSNINAAIGSTQLVKLPSFFAKKNELSLAYIIAIKENNLNDIFYLTQNIKKTDCLHIFSCLLPPKIDRKNIMQALKQEGIECGFHYVPNHTHTLFRSCYSLPNSEELGLRLISLPFHPSMQIDDTIFVIETLKKFILG